MAGKKSGLVRAFWVFFILRAWERIAGGIPTKINHGMLLILLIPLHSFISLYFSTPHIFLSNFPNFGVAQSRVSDFSNLENMHGFSLVSMEKICISWKTFELSRGKEGVIKC